jgi:hypothetical protein
MAEAKMTEDKSVGIQMVYEVKWPGQSMVAGRVLYRTKEAAKKHLAALQSEGHLGVIVRAKLTYQKKVYRVRTTLSYADGRWYFTMCGHSHHWRPIPFDPNGRTYVSKKTSYCRQPKSDTLYTDALGYKYQTPFSHDRFWDIRGRDDHGGMRYCTWLQRRGLMPSPCPRHSQLVIR